MADLTLTGTSVVAGAGSGRKYGLAGETITPGQAVYLDPTTLLWMKSDNNSGTAAAKKCNGIALNGAALNQTVGVLTDGDITIGATIVKGTVYCLSATAGGICPQADITTGNDVVILGVAKTAAILHVEIIQQGITL